MRVLIVKLSSLGDIVHALPSVQDIRTAHPAAGIDWVVEPGFAPLLRRVDGLDRIVECPMRRWRRTWWQRSVRAEWRSFVGELLRSPRALADGPCDPGRAACPCHRPCTRIGVTGAGPAPADVLSFGLRGHSTASSGAARTLVLVHGTSRSDKLWPEPAWIEIGQRVATCGWRVALPHSGSEERARAERIAHAVGAAADVWPQMPLDALIDRMALTHGVIGVDSGLSHMAVALSLPHVQVYALPTAWRTGPLPEHGRTSQVSVEGQGEGVGVEAVWQAWTRALDSIAARRSH